MLESSISKNWNMSLPSEIFPLKVSRANWGKYDPSYQTKSIYQLFYKDCHRIYIWICPSWLDWRTRSLNPLLLWVNKNAYKFNLWRLRPPSSPTNQKPIHRAGTFDSASFARIIRWPTPNCKDTTHWRKKQTSSSSSRKDGIWSKHSTVSISNSLPKYQESSGCD